MKIEYHNLYTHFVFTTINRQNLIPEKNRNRIEKYVTGVINNTGSRLYAIYANMDHMHFLVSRNPSFSEERLATIVAQSSEKFINNNKLSDFYFRWQQSASAFSVSKFDVDRVCKYILNQPEHHKTTTSTDEYEQFIKNFQNTLSRGDKIQ
ncbi:MAG: transposase [Chitinispirillaceae bacterium]